MQQFHQMQLIIQKHVQKLLFHQPIYNIPESKNDQISPKTNFNQRFFLTTRENNLNVSKSSSILLVFVVNKTI